MNCSSDYGAAEDGGEREELQRSVGEVVGNVVRVAIGEGKGGLGFGVGEVKGVYALAQCWKSLGIDGCRICLKKAEKAVRGCLPKREGRALNAGCYLRYSTRKFYNDAGEAESGDGKCFLFLRRIISGISIG